MGSATAATQIEGGDTNSNWYHWSQAGNIANGESSIVASDHYHRYLEDIALMQEMHHDIYRMSIEWSRIEPTNGQWSQAGVDHYRAELEALLRAGIRPLVSLHHFSHPQWFEAIGQWTSAEAVYYFTRFVKKVVTDLGDLISDYCTINEPNVFALGSFIYGYYPPGKKGDIVSYLRASRNMIKAHIASYNLIHTQRQAMGYQDSQVGIAMHLTYMEAKSGSVVAKLSKRMLDYVFHQIFLNGMVDGCLTFPFGWGTKKGKRYADYMGINYYSRHVVHPSANPAMLFGEVKVDEQVPKERLNDMGWEIFPEGLHYLLKANYQRYQLPIYITENGIPDSDDVKRSQFIYDHLQQIERLIAEGVDVQRYYHWSLLDNLEWHDGYTPRFGLVAVDYTDQSRTIRDSGRFYGEICRTKGVDQAMLKRYLE